MLEAEYDASEMDGRDLTPSAATLAWLVAIVAGVVGLVMMLATLLGHSFSPWHSASSLTPGLLGAAMAGVAPGLFGLARATRWEDARTLLYPVAVVTVGLLAVSLVNAGDLQFHGGSLIPAVFSLGWVVVLASMAAASLYVLARQAGEPALAPAPPTGGLPPWTRPLVAVLGAALLGIGAGLSFIPHYWGAFVPWAVNRVDAQGLGVWCLALGVGVLAALAEDELSHIAAAILAVLGVGVAVAVTLAVRTGDVHWRSGPGAATLALVAGLVLTGLIGRLLLRAHR